MKRNESYVQAIAKNRVRILVVEGDADAATVLGARLERFGYLLCDIVCTGREAIASTLQHQPDLILMDIQLGEGMNGIETAARIKEKFDIPIIFLDYPVIRGALEPIVKTNSYGYLVKPYDYVELRLNIEMALFKHRAAREREKLDAKLEKALKEVRKLSSLLPICASCRKIRDDRDYWQEIENHIASRMESEFPRSICPECSRRLSSTLYPIGPSTSGV
ncbi:MAG: response regulator [Deltaproteobacteria bacterium]